MALLVVFTFISFLSISIAEDRAHGLANYTPIVISPEAYAFFHPNTFQPSTSNTCDKSACSTLPFAATVQSAPSHERKTATTGGGGLGAGSIAGIFLSFIFVCLLGMGAYHVMIKRRANLQGANPEQLEKV